MKLDNSPAGISNFKPQASADLMYRLLNGNVSLDPLKIIRERTVAWGIWRVTFYVLGASHAMRFSRKHRQLTELLSCGPAPDDDSIVMEVGVRRDPSMTGNLRDLRVKFTLRHHALTEVEPFEGRIDDENWLEHAFPNQDIDEPSWTQLRWEVTPDAVRLETLHTYPHEGVCIRGVTSVSEIRRSKQESVHGE